MIIGGRLVGKGANTFLKKLKSMVPIKFKILLYI